MPQQLTPARFVALYELAINPAPIGHLDKRTARALMDNGLIEWCDTTPRAHIYRATPAGVEAARAHLAYLAKREAAGRLYRSDDEQQYQDRAEYRLDQLEKALAEEHPETPADRIAAAEEPPVEGRVIAHAGGTVGTDPEHANHPTVRAAITALTNAGHTPVTVTGEFDPEPGDGTTGFYVEPRHTGTPDECVYVHDVLDGNRTWKRDTNSKLSAYGKALTDAGWSIPTGHSRAVPALSPVEPAPAPKDIPSKTLTPGTRVTTPHGAATITQPPSQMASGWTVKVTHDTPHTASGQARYRVDELTPATSLPKRTPGATRIQDAITRHRNPPATRQAILNLRPDQKRAIIRANTRGDGRLFADPYVYVLLIGAGLVRTKRGRRYLTAFGREVAQLLADTR